MKVLFLMYHAGHTRDFGSTLRCLVDRGHEVHVAFERVEVEGAWGPQPLADAFRAEYPAITVGSVPQPPEDDWALVSRRLRASLDYLHYLRPEFDATPELRIRAADFAPPRVDRVLSSVPRSGRAVVGRAVRSAERSTPISTNVRGYVLERQPDALLVAALVDPSSDQPEFVRAANELGIATCHCLTATDDLATRGLIHVHPDALAVHNAQQVRDAVDVHGVPAERVVLIEEAPRLVVTVEELVSRHKRPGAGARANVVGRALSRAARRQMKRQRAQHRAAKQAKAEAKLARRKAFELPNANAAVAEMLARPAGLPLEQYARRVLSQHGEDGVTIEVLRRAGIEHRRAVEIGCGANGGNAGVLVAGAEFDGLLLDGSEELVEIARKLFDGLSAHVECRWITRETVNELLAERRFDRELDYLGIDLDGVDWWIWESLAVRPRIVICEYNPMFGAEAEVTVPYSAEFSRKRKLASGEGAYPEDYFGASLAGFERLARHKGYRLVGTTPGSQNAYFVRDDLAAEFDAVSAADAWRPLTKGKDPSNVPEQKLRRLQLIEQDGAEEYFGSRGYPLVGVDTVLERDATA